MHPSTTAARAPGAPDPTYGGLVPPVVPSTTYARDADGGYPGGHSYSRDQNPTGEPAERLLAELEGGKEAMLFASGMAAATAVLDALPPDSHVVAPRQMYWTIRGWLEHLERAGSIRLTLLETTDVPSWEAALSGGGSQLAWTETPSNPMLDVTDLEAVAEVAHRAGAVVVTDNTTPTPVHTTPLDLGVDLVFHSATKQLNGHGDVLAGALVTRTEDELWEAVRYERAYRGAVLGPFEAWLLLRGMRTLWVRVPRSAATALALADALVGHPTVAEVRYPGLADHPGHEIATRQMREGFGMLLSLRLRGGEDAVRAALPRFELFADATSLGSTESLVEHRRRIEGPDSPVPGDLLRLSIGLEDPDDLLADLRQALAPGP